MNKLNKILLVIIVLLIITFGTSMFFCVKYYNLLLSSNKAHSFTIQAINDAGFDVLMREDGSCYLVERESTD